MRRLTIILTLFFLTFSGISLGFELEGTVYSPQGQALTGARIRLLDEHRREIGKDYTDRKGNYRMSNLPAGNYSLEVTKRGLSRHVEQVSINGPSYNERLYKDVYMIEFHSGARLSRADLRSFYLPPDHKIPLKAIKQFNKGMKYLKIERFKKAAKAFKKAIKADPTFSRAYTHLAISYHKLNNDDEAIELLHKAMQTNPKDPLPVLNLAIIYLQQEKREPAHEALRKTLELDPTLSKPHILLADLYYREKKWESVISEFSQALSTGKTMPGKYRLMYANACLKLNRIVEARSQFRAFLRENPYNEKEDEIKRKIQDIDTKLIRDEQTRNK